MLAARLPARPPHVGGRRRVSSRVGRPVQRRRPARARRATAPPAGTVARGVRDLVAAALRAAGVERAVVAGLSMGGYVALALARASPRPRRRPRRWWTRSRRPTPPRRAPTGCASPTRPRRPGRSTPVRPMATSLLGETTRCSRPEVADEVTAGSTQQEPAGVAWSQRAMAARPDRTEVLRAFDGPVVVVVGDEDTVTPRRGRRAPGRDVGAGAARRRPARRAPVGGRGARRGRRAALAARPARSRRPPVRRDERLAPERHARERPRQVEGLAVLAAGADDERRVRTAPG